MKHVDSDDIADIAFSDWQYMVLCVGGCCLVLVLVFGQSNPYLDFN